MSGRTLSAAHFSMSWGGMWLYVSRLSTVSGSNRMESMNWLWGHQDQVGAGCWPEPSHRKGEHKGNPAQLRMGLRP